MKHLLPIALRVNGETHNVLVAPWRTLLEVLRESLALTGTKRSCQEGQCGTCTVLIDGKPINSCLYLAVEAQGKDILTIEGLAKGGVLDQIQKSFVQKGGIQCGFCTPGILTTVVPFLEQNPDPSEEEIREAISGNLCRCTGYQHIVDAIKLAAQKMRE